MNQRETQCSPESNNVWRGSERVRFKKNKELQKSQVAQNLLEVCSKKKRNDFAIHYSKQEKEQTIALYLINCINTKKYKAPYTTSLIISLCLT